MTENKIKVLPTYLYEGEIWRHNYSGILLRVSKTDEGTFLSPISGGTPNIVTGETITYCGMPVPEGQEQPIDRKMGMTINIYLEP